MAYGSESVNSNFWWLLVLIIAIIIIIIIVVAVSNSDDNGGGGGNKDVNFIIPHIDGDQEVPPSEAKGSGKGTGVLSADRNSFYYNIVVKHKCDITSAHFHFGAKNENGPVAKTLAFRNKHEGVWTASGVWSSSDASEPLDSTAVNELLANRVYVNIHSRKHPKGAIRGQVLVE